MQPTQTPTACNSFPVTLTLDELETIVFALESLTDYTPIYTKLKFLLPIPNIGDACRHSAHIPEAPGQGGTIQTDVLSHPFYCVCDVCRTCLDFYDEADKGQGGTTQTDVSSHSVYCVCDVCRTDVVGQGGNQ